MADVYNSSADFVLFPRERLWSSFQSQSDEHSDTLYRNQAAVLTMNRHQDFSGRDNTSYDSYPQFPAYSPASSNFYTAPDAPLDQHKGHMVTTLQRATPSGSPSPATSQIFDQTSSNISSASGASANSTASSTDGSPYANATQAIDYQDKWSEPLHGLGIPEIVSTEGFRSTNFPPNSFNDDLMLEDSKFANFVGEYSDNFSPVPSRQSAGPSKPSSPALQVYHSVLSTSQTSETVDSVADVTIDSILKEANDRIPRSATHLMSPVSVTSMATSPTFPEEKYPLASPKHHEDAFKSPLTPASATSQFPSRAPSPYPSTDHSSPQQFPASNGDARLRQDLPQSPVTHRPQRRQTSSPISRSHFPFERIQNPFFSQSSGRFVAPLESSCWFSLCFCCMHALIKKVLYMNHNTRNEI